MPALIGASRPRSRNSPQRSEPKPTRTRSHAAGVNSSQQSPRPRSTSSGSTPATIRRGAGPRETTPDHEPHATNVTEITVSGADAAHLRQVFERVDNLVVARPIVLCDRFEQGEVNPTQSWEATMVQFFSGAGLGIVGAVIVIWAGRLVLRRR